MASEDGVEGEEGTNSDKQPGYDLARLKWLDPCSDARFTRRELVRCQDVSNETCLESILRLTDQIFDYLSVFEQFSETTSRGARADPEKKLCLPNVGASLRKAEDELWKVYGILKDSHRSFVDQQLETLHIGEQTKGLKVHIGSGAHILGDWLNIDAGGVDLTLNVNWGLQLPSGCAKYVYCAHLLEHLRYSDQAPVLVREVHRILAEGGTVRLVVPDAKKLLVAYAKNDREFFATRAEFYPLSSGFMNDGIVSLDYILLFCGAGPQLLNYNHKFGYDSSSLCSLLTSAGFKVVRESMFQASAYSELRVDDYGDNARAKNRENQHYSLFVEATK